MANFKQKAVDSMTLSVLEHNRTNISTEDIVGKELTIDKFDLVDVQEENLKMRYGVFVFKELPDNFYNGGLILTKMIDSWCEDYDSLEECQQAYNNLSDKEKVRIKSTMGKTKNNNNNLLKVEVL